MPAGQTELLVYLETQRGSYLFSGPYIYHTSLKQQIIEASGSLCGILIGMKLNNRVAIVLFIIFGILLIAGGIRGQLNMSGSMRGERLSATTLERQFMGKVSAIGFASAYHEIEIAYPTGSFAGHMFDHIIGTYLFKRYGMDGLRYCGNHFAQGCGHQIIDILLANNGIEHIPVIETYCRSLPEKKIQGCHHGIGHGLIEYMGRKKLADVLAICKKIDGRTAPFGCTYGVFMEYFFPSMFSSSREIVARCWTPSKE